MELRLQGILAGAAMAATLMLSGCGDDDTYDYYYYVPPPPGQITEAIAFMAYPNDSFEIWGMKADGSKKTPLAYIVNGGAIQGVFSPDGHKLLFVKQDATGSKLIEKNLQSGALKELVTDSSNNPFTPSYSPDGTKIAYHDERDGIHVMNSGGPPGLPLPNTTSADTTPSWNSSGTKIVFVRGWPSNGRIWVMDPDGSDPIEIQADATELGFTYWQPRYLPDGRIVCMRQSTSLSLDIVILNANGSEPVNLTPGTDDSNEFYPSVNLAGNKIAFATDRLGHQDVYVGTLTGTTLTNLVNLTGDIDFDCWRPSFGNALLP
ncbi:hypothetical protein EG832_00275 [bacterium]|nr:hypothetical protein [bacterium]